MNSIIFSGSWQDLASAKEQINENQTESTVVEITHSDNSVKWFARATFSSNIFELFVRDDKDNMWTYYAYRNPNGFSDKLGTLTRMCIYPKEARMNTILEILNAPLNKDVRAIIVSYLSSIGD